jgi:MYXO-CTERM domain-containing protein
MDAGPNSDQLLRMDYSQASGSGSGDMFVYVKSSLFTGSGPYVTLYSKFGTPDASDAGFEEWATRQAVSVTPTSTVPLPASVWGGLTLLGLIGAARIRSRRRSA